MVRKRGTGLLMEWLDVDLGAEADFNRWYDDEEVGRLAATPGILNVGRYEAVEGGPKYLTVCELEDGDVLRGPAYVAASHTCAMQFVRNYLRLGYRQIFPAMIDAETLIREMPPYFQLGRIDIATAREEEFNDWYDTAYIPSCLAIEGCLGARRFVAIDGRPKYLTLYELADPMLRHSPAWLKARDGNPWNARMFPLRHGKGSPGVYRRRHPA